MFSAGRIVMAVLVIVLLLIPQFVSSYIVYIVVLQGL